MKRQLRLKYLIKAAQDTSKDYELYLEAKTVAENNLSLDIPGIEELAELKEKEAALRTQWQNEVQAIKGQRETKETLEKLRQEQAQAERQGAATRQT